jgi:hypothetical protein
MGLFSKWFSGGVSLHRQHRQVPLRGILKRDGRPPFKPAAELARGDNARHALRSDKRVRFNLENVRPEHAPPGEVRSARAILQSGCYFKGDADSAGFAALASDVNALLPMPPSPTESDLHRIEEERRHLLQALGLGCRQFNRLGQEPADPAQARRVLSRLRDMDLKSAIVHYRTLPGEGDADDFHFDAEFTAVWRTALLLEKFRLRSKVCKPQATAADQASLDAFLRRALVLTDADSFPPVSSARWPGRASVLKSQDALSTARDILAGGKKIERTDLENLRKRENRIDHDTAEWMNQLLEGVRTYADRSVAKADAKKAKKTAGGKVNTFFRHVSQGAAKIFRPFRQPAKPFNGLRHVPASFVDGKPDLPPGFIQAPSPGQKLVSSAPTRDALQSAMRRIVASLQPGEEVKLYYQVQASTSSSALVHSLCRIGTGGSVTFTLGPNITKGLQSVMSIASTGAALQVFIGREKSSDISASASVRAALPLAEAGIVRAGVAGVAHAAIGRSSMRRQGVQIVLPCAAGKAVGEADKASCADLVIGLLDGRGEGQRPVEWILTTFDGATMSRVDAVTKGKNAIAGANIFAGIEAAVGVDDLNGNTGDSGAADMKPRLGVTAATLLKRQSAKTETTIRGAAGSHTQSAWSQTNLERAVYLAGAVAVGRSSKDARARGIVHGASDLYRKQTRLADKPIAGLTFADTRDGIVARKKMRFDQYKTFRAFAEGEMRTSLNDGTRPEALPHWDGYKARQNRINASLKTLEASNSAKAFEIDYELRSGSREAAVFRNAMNEARILEAHGHHDEAEVHAGQAHALLKRRQSWQVTGITASRMEDYSSAQSINFQLPYQVRRKSGVSREMKKTEKLSTEDYPRNPELQFPQPAAALRIRHLIVAQAQSGGNGRKLRITRGDLPPPVPV